MPRERAGAATAIILFADIVDSTALTERMGDAAFRGLARRLDGSLRSIIRTCAGEAIEGKLLGDGVLGVFSSAQRAIDCGLRCAAEGSSAGLPLHVGVHAGDVIRESNNVFGGAVNIAARIAAISGPGEVLVSDTLRGLARTSTDVLFEDAGSHEFKGVGEPMRVFRAQRRRGGIALPTFAGGRSKGSRVRWLAAYIGVAALVAGVTAAAFLFVQDALSDDGDEPPALASSVLTVGEQSVRLDVVRRPEEKSSVRRDEQRAQGDGAGILHDGVEPSTSWDTSVYESAVDLIWLDATKQVLAVDAEVTGGGDSSGAVTVPPGARYGLELNSGAAGRLGIVEGATLNVYTATRVSTPGGPLNAEVACLDKEMREIGHVGRAALEQDGGLLYNWQDRGTAGWSTVGYLFAIDIVWLDEQKTVISVMANVEPEGSEIPKPDAMYYALETNAGAAERFGLVPGTVLAFDVPCDPA